MAPKDEILALSSGTRLAGRAISYFDDCYETIFGAYWDEIFQSVLKPVPFTSVHYMLHHFQNIRTELIELREDMEDNELVYDFIRKTLQEIDLQPSLSEPNFYDCNDEEGHFECECSEIIQKWVDFVEKNQDRIDNLIVHSAFQIIFQDRSFLRNFHLKLAEIIEATVDELTEKYPEGITVKGTIKRQYFPKWLISAVFYRDKGTCVKCRCDLSNLIRSQNTINIDHIVPLDNYGNNDASNFQLLCERCNKSKGARSSFTSTVNVPFWNLPN